ncbi:hypothetical protein ASPSYDRAFT_133441 [Aspergillus sydowii CBS 593.65]|uniref:Uncharacterized protein n=1 Tax=Aspergillus sydowii CBS 593.65 TaxID=1036612 RepID=A0A1L9TDA9_9EURO|nr:uncharacterized protein ASPSYDRAFT_133441 [Aspergillus sydowii CBS 593.65]OJJ57407.1 hypothetical protein ASPSYDRAFT_133441 [Aspergillus sydowii CBS 593.65]
MKFQLATVLTLLLPLALAMPAPEAEPENPMPVPELIDDGPQDTSPQALGLEKRSTVRCKIVKSSSASVNCRTGPGFSYPVLARAVTGSTHSFYCYKSGDCYNGNCTWDRAIYNGQYCYINGYYTDNKCTVAALGAC